MNDSRHELLDIHELERMVARALIALIDDRNEPHPITFSRLVARSALPKRRVREVTREWNLQTVSGDAFMLTPSVVEHARALAASPAGSRG